LKQSSRHQPPTGWSRTGAAQDPHQRHRPGHTETEGNLAAGTFESGAGAVLAGTPPLGRLGRVTDIAPLAVSLASDESAWITGEVIRAAGGLVVAT
jgi:NAD(P)-dependent dehydrogenase (short-subunit alcohol dehydrogenase family)